MWHPLDLIPAALESAARDARPGDQATFTFAELIIARFSDKSDTTAQWPAVVETGPGIMIRRHPDRLEVRHELLHSCRHLLTGNVSIGPNQRVLAWEFESRVYDRSADRAIVPTTIERGRHAEQELLIESVAGDRRISRKLPAAGVVSVHQALCTPASGLAQASHVLADDLSIVPLRSQRRRDHVGHPLAQSLSCEVLVPDMGFPIELWSNEAGAVVFAVMGPTRVLMLQSIEVMP